jgi:hypothetical protein
MKWIKKGIIFNPSEYRAGNEFMQYAQSPQTLVFDDFVRIYFSTRKNDEGEYFLSHVAFIDIDKKFEKIFAYTCGWSRRVSVPVETSTGFAVSDDDGLTFKKVGTGPVLSSSLNEPMLVGDSFVKKYDGLFHMWYIFGKKWLLPHDNEPAARVYKIAHATSEDGITWTKEEGKQIIADSINENECQALPSVIKIADTYHMYFCYRHATDFRKNTARGYRIGYAHSSDLLNWIRDDTKAGISVSETGWDSEMMCYPHIFECDGKVYLLYNGNEFGKHGFGIAVLDDIAT